MSSLRARIAAARPQAASAVMANERALSLADLARNTGLGDARAALAGRCVLLWTRSQIGAVQGLVELDGLARRLILCPPNVPREHLVGLAAAAGVEAVLTDDAAAPGVEAPIHRLAPPSSPAGEEGPDLVTEWLLLTSGTTGAPKMAIHDLGRLTGAVGSQSGQAVWATFYDVRRYGGLQALLRALVGGCAMALCEPGELVGDQLTRLGRLGVTHLTGTPSHWRKVLMSSQSQAIDPAYVRLSGEIVDQAVLDALRKTYPKAAIVHAYASTEAGVCFEVRDGKAGFPEAVVSSEGPVQMKVEDGSLRVRSPRMASGYAGPAAPALVDADGYLDTGDLVELSGGRWRFVGRRNGVINIGGLKVHPEEIEAVLNSHPAVRLSRVIGRPNPIVGSVVVAEVSLRDPGAAGSKPEQTALRASILDACRAALPAHKRPASITFVADLAVNAAGKLERGHV